MLEVFESSASDTSPTDFSLVLTYDERQKSRYRTETSCGRTVGWFLEHGNILVDGEVLVAKDGSRIKVSSASESLSCVTACSPLLLLQAAYHLGNRHVPLQVNKNALYYQHDHVLDAMVEGLGLNVDFIKQAFNPESGAYHSHATEHHHHE